MISTSVAGMSGTPSASEHNACGAIPAARNSSSHASMRCLRDGGHLRRSRRKPRADREHHLLDVVGQRFLEREGHDLPQARLARGGQRGFRRQHVDGVDQRRAAPAGERRPARTATVPRPRRADEPPGARRMRPRLQCRRRPNERRTFLPSYSTPRLRNSARVIPLRSRCSTERIVS